MDFLDGAILTSLGFTLFPRAFHCFRTTFWYASTSACRDSAASLRMSVTECNSESREPHY